MAASFTVGVSAPISIGLRVGGGGGLVVLVFVPDRRPVSQVASATTADPSIIRTAPVSTERQTGETSSAR